MTSSPAFIMNPFHLLFGMCLTLRRWSVLVVLSLSALVTCGQGTLLFSNYGAGIESDTRVLDALGNPLGSAYLAQLYANGVGAPILIPVGQPAAFLNHPTNGAPSGFVIGGVVTLPGVSENGLAQVQLRVWLASGGASYEAALAAGAPVGTSGVVTLATGGGIHPPPMLKGLQGFRLPPRFSLTLAGNPNVGGTILASPPPGPDGKYTAGSSVTLLAQPAAGYRFSNWTGAATGSTPDTTVTMTANATVTAGFRVATPGAVQFSKADYTVPEAGGQVVLTLNRVGGTDGAVSVRCNLAVGTTASQGFDFSFTPVTLSWADGDSTPRTVNVGIVDDFDVEPTEAVLIRLTSPTGGLGLGVISIATIAILNDDFSGTLQFQRTVWWGTEAGKSATIAVTRTGGSAGVVSVAYSTSDGSAQAPGDYTPTNGVLTWVNGDVSPKIFSIPIRSDALKESTETINLELSAPQGGASVGLPGIARLYITDKEPDVWAEMFAGIYVRGTIGRTYQILAGTDLVPEASWPVVAEITLSKEVELWIDPETPVRGERFYRTREKP